MVEIISLEQSFFDDFNDGVIINTFKAVLNNRSNIYSLF